MSETIAVKVDWLERGYCLPHRVIAAIDALLDVLESLDPEVSQVLQEGLQDEYDYMRELDTEERTTGCPDCGALSGEEEEPDAVLHDPAQA